MSIYIDKCLAQVQQRDPDQPQFLSVLRKMLDSLAPFLEKNPGYGTVLPHITEPERVITFRVIWEDDHGNEKTNRGFVVQFNQAIGPYKGGLSFHPSINLDVVKAVGFEQIFKNALTGLPMGGTRGGSDFDPKGKSSAEVTRFCQAFMAALNGHVNAAPEVLAAQAAAINEQMNSTEYSDYPEGDNNDSISAAANDNDSITVSSAAAAPPPKRVNVDPESYQATKVDQFLESDESSLGPKGVSTRAAPHRPQVGGHGVAYFAQRVVEDLFQESLEDSFCVVSGSGAMALHTASKLLELGAKVQTLSDSRGYLYARPSLTFEQLEKIRNIQKLLHVESRKSILAAAAAASGAAGAAGHADPTTNNDTFGGPSNMSATSSNSGARRNKQTALQIFAEEYNASQSGNKGPGMVTYVKGAKAWQSAELGAVDYAFPCATINELDNADAIKLVSLGLKAIFEGANVPITTEAQNIFVTHDVVIAPSKACNAGSVGVAGLEERDTADYEFWNQKDTDEKLQGLMADIFGIITKSARQHCNNNNRNLRVGANVAAFKKVADAIIAARAAANQAEAAAAAAAAAGGNASGSN